MAGSAPRVEDGKKKARIEIIPLIDVVFFLLATFVLFTLSLNKIASLPVDLPVATNSPPQQQDNDMVTIQVSDQGTYYWNHELITASELPPRIENYKKSTNNPRILIAGDDKAKFGPAAMLFDEVRKAGIAQVSIETRSRATGQ